ncbi:hypothetical protein WN51_06657 [Melipona quadrifasciata]|uniref:Uncharacterized protein n=1 Tax=Melipona quadrifasciata TaxID=166423 RepID=A0A0N0BKC0_9HYME|nr:hypothetical protein WN51_06657 [Melipona quadrifasciata]
MLSMLCVILILSVATSTVHAGLKCDAVRPYFESQGFPATDIPKEAISYVLWYRIENEGVLRMDRNDGLDISRQGQSNPPAVNYLSQNENASLWQSITYSMECQISSIASLSFLKFPRVLPKRNTIERNCKWDVATFDNPNKDEYIEEGRGHSSHAKIEEDAYASAESKNGKHVSKMEEGKKEQQQQQQQQKKKENENEKGEKTEERKGGKVDSFFFMMERNVGSLNQMDCWESESSSRDLVTRNVYFVTTGNIICLYFEMIVKWMLSRLLLVYIVSRGSKDGMIAFPWNEVPWI